MRRWAVAIFLALLSISGCAPRLYTLDFPLSDGSSWEYASSVQYQAMGKTVTMPAPRYQILVTKRERDVHSLQVLLEGVSAYNFSLQRGEEGILEVSGAPQILFPRKARKGDQWSLDLFGDKVAFTFKGEEELKTPAGKRKAFLLSFKAAQEPTSGEIWLSPSEGVLSFRYTSKGQGAKAETVATLEKYTLK